LQATEHERFVVAVVGCSELDSDVVCELVTVVFEVVGPPGDDVVGVAEFPFGFCCGEAVVDRLVLLENRAGGSTLGSALGACG